MTTTWHKSTCPFCGLGCGLQIGLDQGRITKVRGMKDHPVNKGDICRLPANYPSMLYHEDRLKHPMIKKDNTLTPVSWETAVSHVADRLKHLVDTHGPDAIAFYGGAINLTEEYYAMNKLMKAAIGSNNMECSTRICMASTAVGFISTLGADAPPNCYADIEEADLFLIAGSNMAISSPVMFRRIVKVKKKKGAKIIVIDPRKTKTAEAADLHLQIRPGTDVALNNAIAHALFEEGFVNESNVEKYASGLEALKLLLQEYPPSYGSQISGCPEKQIIDAARLIGSAGAMTAIWMQGYNHSTQAVFKNNSLHNLWILTNNFSRPGAGPISITGECNAMGNRWVGALSHLLPGMRFVTDPHHRQEMADFWNIPVENIRATPGRSILDIIKGLHSGDIQCLWVTTTNPAASLPHSAWVKEGLSKAKMLIVQDIYHPTETTLLSDVIFPAAQWFEKTGTCISSERRIELVEKLIDPPGEAKPDLEIICEVARALGFKKEFPFTSAEDAFNEFKALTKGRICDMSGISYEALRNRVGPQLPFKGDNSSGTRRLFTDLQFPRADGRLALLARAYKAPAETTDENYPVSLMTGRIAGHFNTRTRTGRSPKLNDRSPDGFIGINPKDAEKSGILQGDKVKIKSRRGEICLPVHIDKEILKGTVFIPWHYGPALGTGEGKSANDLTNAVYDMHSKQPEYKFSAVSIRLFSKK